ncbi:MAG: TetR family transcriptional regulator [Candidatus Nanopelagicales bacterium]|nr:TetR family transcriptional regulator [Candidatus Nanopelagicales bacterium]
MSDDPRDALLAVAREIVAKRGYMGLSMRTVSAAAGVTEDVALRYFRNRDALFAAALRLPVDPVSAIPALMAPGIEGMGERLVRLTLDTLRDPTAREDLMSLARTGVSAGQAITGLQEFIEVGVVDRVAGMIGVPDARMRSALITSYLLGVATMRYGVRLEPLASASDEEVIRMVAPVIQDLLDPRRPIPGSARARARADSSNQPASTAPGARTRTFDPDPAATRAAEAARLAAMLSESDARRSAGGPSTGRSAAAKAPTRGAASRSTTAATEATRATSSSRTAARRTAARAAAKVAPVTEGTTAAPLKATPTKASAKAATRTTRTSTTKSTATTKPTRTTKSASTTKPTTSTEPAEPGPAPAVSSSTSRGTRKAAPGASAGSGTGSGPKHAKVSTDPATADGEGG